MNPAPPILSDWRTSLADAALMGVSTNMLMESGVPYPCSEPLFSKANTSLR